MSVLFLKFFLFTSQIGSCTKLSVLSVRNNDLSKVPRQIGNCRNLTVFDLSGNRYKAREFN